MGCLNPFLDKLIPLKLNFGLRIPSVPEPGIFRDWLGRIQTKTEEMADLPVKLGRVSQWEANFPSVLHNPRLVLARNASQMHNESERHEETCTDYRMNLDWPEKLRKSS